MWKTLSIARHWKTEVRTAVRADYTLGGGPNLKQSDGEEVLSMIQKSWSSYVTGQQPSWRTTDQSVKKYGLRREQRR